MPIYLYSDSGEIMFESKSFNLAKRYIIKSLKEEVFFKDDLKKFRKNPKKYLKLLTYRQLNNIKRNYESFTSS